MNVLSLFDGMSCGQIALRNIGVIPKSYYACEVDKYAVKVSSENFPQTIHLGDVTKVDFKALSGIDLLIGGSPCQGFSLQGKQLNFNDPRSKLFFEFVRAKNETSPKYFLLENVKMKKSSMDIISKQLGTEPVEINSSLFSAQNRPRLYWTNIPFKEPVEDKGDLLWDILDKQVPINNEPYVEKYNCNKPVLVTNRRFPCLRANAGSRTRGIGIKDTNGKWRKLTVDECKKLQTVPSDYLMNVSNAQAYKMLGNGWTVKVIEHILKYIKDERTTL